MNLDWELMDERIEQVGHRKIAHRQYKMPDDRLDDYTIYTEDQAVCIAAFTADQQVILVKQFRPGPGKVLHELPDGGIEPGEEPIDAAKRELLEESGYQGNLHFLQPSWGNAYSTLKRFNFIATNCHKVQEPQGDGFEFLETVLMPLDQFRSLVHSGEPTDLTTALLGLEYLGEK